MKTSIEDRDLTQQRPHSPRERVEGFAILARTVDKCRASLDDTLGEYHFDCPLDNQLFGFKGINGAQFKIKVTSAQSYEEVAQWLQSAGTPRTPQEIEQWSDSVESARLKDIPTFQSPDKKKEMREECKRLGLDFESVSLFDWLEADDKASFEPHLAGR